MKLPNCVYKDSGPHQRPGGNFDYLHVTTHGELVEAIKSGWCPSLKDAINYQDFRPDEFLKNLPKEDGRENAEVKTVGKTKKDGKEKVAAKGQTIEEEKSKRKLLELEAKQMGLAFDNKISDSELFNLISKSKPDPKAK